MKKQTAVEWLETQVKNFPTPENLMTNIDKLFIEAKQKEKEQYNVDINAVYSGSAMACPHRLQDSCTLRTVAGCFDETCDINARNIRQ